MSDGFLISDSHTHQSQVHTCQPREKFSRDKRGPTERSEPASEGGCGGPPPEIKKKTILQMVQSQLFLSYISEYN